MNSIAKFKDIHKGKTLLIVGLGENLKLTPPEMFDYPSISVNEIHLYKGWKPTYYTCVDRNNKRDYGEKIATDLADIPKFIPTPRMDKWKGKNFYRFRNMTGPLWPLNKAKMWQEKENMILDPMVYANITHVAIKLAYFMGAKNILIIGMQHRPHAQDRHFYGVNLGMSADQDVSAWFKGYKVLSDGLEKKGIKLLNISEDTYVPDEVIKTDDYKNWLPVKKSKKQKAKNEVKDG